MDQHSCGIDISIPEHGVCSGVLPHPTDGWALKSNEKVGVNVAQPTTLAERVSVAEQCAAKFNPKMPLLVDDINDTVGPQKRYRKKGTTRATKVLGKTGKM